MRRIENIVDEIAKLRVDYEECSVKLQAKNASNSSFKKALKVYNEELIKKYKFRVKEEKQKNDELIKKTQELEKLVKNQEILLKTKEQKIIALQETNVKSVKAKERNISEKPTMKEGRSQLSSKSVMETPKMVKPSVYRLDANASLYDAIAGNEILKWEKNKSFTSNVQSQNWIKVTGYFLDRKWLPSKREMWMRLGEVEKK